MYNIAIFASGNGTNAENIIRYFKCSDKINVSLVICNNSLAGVIERAHRLCTPVQVVNKCQLSDSQYIITLLNSYNVNTIVLAGFMLLIPEFLIDKYENKIFNIHPSLLPKYGGKGMYGNYVHLAVKQNCEIESGITIHYVNKEYDKGNIIAQFKTELSPDDSVDDIAAKVHKLEYANYPQIIEQSLLK